MDLKRLFSTNKRAETEGRKMFLDAAKTTWLLIARKGNANYKAFLSKILQENQTVLNAKSPEAEAIATRCFKEAAARHLLIGWSDKGIDFGSDKDLPYTVENALKLFDMDDFYQMVDTFASDMSNYRDEEVKAEAGN